MSKNNTLMPLAQSGNKFYINEVVKQNLPLVSHIAKKFLNRGYDYDDIFQNGCIGLMKAIYKFDSTLGFEFSTYATYVIEGEIKGFMRNDSIIRIPRSVKILGMKLNHYISDLTYKLGREPSIEDICSFPNYSKEEILIALKSLTPIAYLESPIYMNDGSATLMIDTLEDNGISENDICKSIDLNNALLKLTKRNREIIIERYINGKTQAQISDMFGVTQVQISRIEKKSLDILRKILK